jgi:Autotransporter beta-domain
VSDERLFVSCGRGFVRFRWKMNFAGGDQVRCIGKFYGALLALTIAIFAVSVGPSPAFAQLAAGCTCPHGAAVVGPTTCSMFHVGMFPATCTAQSVNHIAASTQQLSFFGIEQILQGRRDQLQGTVDAQRSASVVSGYSDSAFDGPSGAMGYASQSQSSNPLASYAKAAPTAAPTNAGPSFASWTQGLGDWEHDDPLSPTSTAHFASTYANQTGVDATWKGLAASDDALVAGIVGSWTGTHVTYDGTPTTTRLEGPGVGLYTTYVKGHFSVDTTLKFDFLRMTTETLSPGPPPLPVNLTNAGLSGNIQYKLDLANNTFVEPTAGYSFTRTMYGINAAANGLSDGNTLRIQAGSRAGVSWTMDTVTAEFSVKTLVYSNVIADGSPTTGDPLSPSSPTDQGKVRGEFDPALSLDLGKGYTLAFSGSVRFGDGMAGGSANVNLRKQW